MPVARFPEMPAVEKPVKSEASIAAAWETAFGVRRAGSGVATDIADARQFFAQLLVDCFELRSDCNVIFTMLKCFVLAEVARPRNDLMHAVQSANSTPATTWDAAFKVQPGMRLQRWPQQSIGAMNGLKEISRRLIAMF